MSVLMKFFTGSMVLFWLMTAPFRAMADDTVVVKKKSKPKPKPTAEASPLSMNIGQVNVKIGGDVDGMYVLRNSNTGSGLATSFNSVPFNNSVQYYETESRLSAQASQFNLTVTDQFDNNLIKGYLETDFLGNSAASLYVTTNSDTLRLRQYWVDMKKGQVEFTVGQAYSLLTPGRHGISPENGDIFLTENLDNSFQVGLSWARQTQFRVAFHPDNDWSFGLSLENPDQYTAGEVTLPTVYNAQLSTQFDNGANQASANVFPDVIGKVALDLDNVHVEAAGFVRDFDISYLLAVTPGTQLIDTVMFETASALGFGGELNTVIGLGKDLRLVGTSFFSYGGGRYLGGLGPDLVVKVSTGPIFTPSIYPVSAYGGIAGVEFDASQATRFGGYFGFDQFESDSQTDYTSSLATQPYIGFGGPNSANSNTAYIREFTLDMITDLWKSDDHGALQWGAQCSYVIREPHFVAAGAPYEADGEMLFTDLKYILP